MRPSLFAIRLLALLERRNIYVFTRREVQYGKWGGCRRVAHVDAALSELKSAGILEETFQHGLKHGAVGPVYRRKRWPAVATVDVSGWPRKQSP